MNCSISIAPRRRPRLIPAAACVAGGLLHGLFLALPLVVWPPETMGRATAVGLFFVGANLFFLVETWASFVERPLDWSARGEDQRALRLAQATGVAVAGTFFAALMESADRSSPGVTCGVGFGLMLLGSGLRGAAMGRLGARFRSEVVVPDECSLETQGVYAWMRHPSETGLALIVAGACLLLHAPGAALLAAALLGPLMVWRVVLEEAHLLRAHGDAYRWYCQGVPRFVPWRWGAGRLRPVWHIGCTLGKEILTAAVTSAASPDHKHRPRSGAMTQILESGQRKAVENRLAEVTKALNAIDFDKTPPENLTPEQTALAKEREELWKQLDQVKTPGK